MAKRTPPYAPEVRARAGRRVRAHRGEHAAHYAAIRSIARTIGGAGETLRNGAGRPSVTRARAAVISELPDLPQEPTLEARPEAEPRERRRVYLGGWREVPVFDLDALAPGQVVEGPAVVGSATTTVLLRPGDRARTTALGWLDVAVAAQ